MKPSYARLTDTFVKLIDLKTCEGICSMQNRAFHKMHYNTCKCLEFLIQVLAKH